MASRDPQEVLATLPEDVMMFSLYDTYSVEFMANGENVYMKSSNKNRSGAYFVTGRVIQYSDVDWSDWAHRKHCTQVQGRQYVLNVDGSISDFNPDKGDQFISR